MGCLRYLQQEIHSQEVRCNFSVINICKMLIETLQQNKKWTDDLERLGAGKKTRGVYVAA